MKTKYLSYGILASSCPFLFSCSIVTSSYHYTKGTECLDKANYQGAIEHLEQAVELDPTMSRNHCNLSFAYGKSGQMQKSWFHAHKAVFLDPTNIEAYQSFYSLYKELHFDQEINSGMSKDEVISLLDEPDKVLSGKITILIYGTLMFKFDSENKLYAKEEIKF